MSRDFIYASKIMVISEESPAEQNVQVSETAQSLFLAIIQNQIQKSHRLLVEGHRALTSGLACKNTSSLHHSILILRYLVQDIMIFDFVNQS